MVQKFLFVASLLFVFATSLKSQSNTPKSNSAGFDDKQAIEQAKAKGMKPAEINGYVQFLKSDFSSKKALEMQAHKHTPYETNNTVLEKVIYLHPNSPQSSGCSNLGFDQYNFAGWTGQTGTISSGGPPVFTTTTYSIINTAGNNTSLVNSTNYHTIMTLPAVSNVYPNCSGYDSLACRAIGSSTISQIPIVSPYSADQASVRLNGALANYRGCRLKYITTTSAQNKQLSYSFALVFQGMVHTLPDAPYFKVEIRNESTGTLITGCHTFMISNDVSTQTADSIKTSAIGAGDIFYRKWQQQVVDLSSLAPGTNVSVMFEVGSCAQGGHYGYAYVDAECSGNNIITSNMCSGSPSASLVAPMGYMGYQWLDPSNNPISGATAYSLSVSNPTVGNIYSVQLKAAKNCIQTQTVAISVSSISISNIGANGSCAGGSTGSATVNTSGGNGTLTYTWTSISTGSIVSNSQTATGLPVGSYSVLVNSGSCGTTSGTVSVPIAAPIFSQQSKSYCGNRTFISQLGGTNYQWYNGTSAVPAPEGINDTLYINNPNNGGMYTLVYTNAGGCTDSTRYTLNRTSNSSIFMSAITNVCNGDTNGSGTINLATGNAAPYNFNVDGPAGQVINTTVSASSLTVNSLAVGVYTTTVYEGTCIHQTTFTVNIIQTNFTMTPNNPGPCSSADTARIGFTFGSQAPANCGLSGSSGTCISPGIIQIGYGNVNNTTNSYPAIYSNYYKNSRNQLLYTAAELTAGGLQPGKISGISFNISAVAGATAYPGFTIKMKCTSASNLTSTFDNINLTQVYYEANDSIYVGWNDYHFPVAYEWDGVSNLLVDVCYSMTANYTANSLSPYTPTSFTSVSHMHDDVVVACATSATATTSNNRPNIRFENCNAISPSSYTISVSSNGTMTHNYNNDSIKIVPVVTPTADIVYTITVTNPEGGCTATQEYTMTATPSGVITTTNASCGTCPNGSITVTPSCGAAPYSYVWAPGGETTQSIGGLLPGCYTVTITDANGQTGTQSTCVTFSTKLSEPDTMEGLSVYPNPNNGLFNVASKSKIESLTITVINPIGQTVMTETAKNTSQLSLDLSRLSKGVYYLRASTGDGSKLFKLVLE